MSDASFKFTAVPAEPRPALIVIHADPEFWDSIARACTDTPPPSGWENVPVIFLRPNETFETLTPERVAEVKTILNEQQL